MASIINIIFGIIPEAVFFSLFMIYAKNIKTKKILFTFLMLLEYIILKSLISFNVWFQILYTFMTYLILKVLYKEDARITDIFMFVIASLILILVSGATYIIVYNTMSNFVVAYILNRFVLFGSFIAYKDLLHPFYKLFNRLWNRRQGNEVRSLTVRNISIIIFNIMFYIINIGMIYFITYLK